MSSRVESLRNYSNQLREALRVHKDQLRDVKELLNQERIKSKRLEDQLREKTAELENYQLNQELHKEIELRKRLEEELKEKDEELDQFRRETNPVTVDNKNTRIKILLSNKNPMDEDMKRKMLENIKNNLRKLLIKNCFFGLCYFCASCTVHHKNNNL